jgi:DNA-binding NarL/FixJ family response regulator
MKCVALVDNYPIVRMGFSQFFKETFSDEFHVEVADDMDGFSSVKLKPDIIILAINGNNMQRFEQQVHVCKSAYAPAKIVVYGDHFDYDELTKLIGMGVSGFMVKSSDISQITTCVNEILHRDHFFCSELVGLILANLTTPKKAVTGVVKARLSAREEEIASYLLKGMKTSDIAERLGRKATTISSIKNNLFRKMNVSNVMALNEAMIRLRM